MGEIITLDNNSPEIQYLCKKDKRLAKEYVGKACDFGLEEACKEYKKIR